MPGSALTRLLRHRLAAVLLCALAAVGQPSGAGGLAPAAGVDPALPRGPGRPGPPGRALTSRPRCSDALLAAARYGNESQLRAALQNETADCVGERGWTALHVAAAAGQRNVTLALLAAGAPLGRDLRGQGPLHLAAEAGHAAVCSTLLGTAGAYTEMVDAMGRTAIHTVAWNGHAAAAEVLLDYGAYTFAQDSEGRTPLHYSVRNDAALELTRMLLARGANPHAKDVVGQQPMHLACLGNQPLSVQAVQAAGADLWSMDKAGWNPLMLAAAGGHEALVSTLVFGVMKPRKFPAPDPDLFQQQESEGILGIPGWAMALAGVGLCACLLMCEATRRLRR
mmetsp:Transcript_64083/g.202490  ORF Transcript_64083/g.202490 Transcript_64083/m.202490 type:complete len:338 (-) Transcript_64083:100-1113(-)